MAQPRTATIATAATIAWSSSENFDGFLLLGLAVPTVSGTGYAQINLDQSPAPLRIPIWTKVPIVAGVLDTGTQAFYNSDIEPPNSKYVAYWYDATGRQIAGPSALFTISSTPYTITPPTLTSPTAPVVGPTPES